MEQVLQGLNTRQAEAVRSTEGRIRVVAGAGTGKTKALTHRYAYLVNVLGIDPANILCLTFTNKAASEMRQRIAAMVQSGDYNDFVCTIHGFCVKFLRKEIYRLGFPRSFSILDEEDSKALAKQAMDELGIKRTEKTVKQFLEGIGAQKVLQGYIETYMLPESRQSAAREEASRMAAYLRLQMKNYALDYDDLLNLTRYILDRFEAARLWWQNELNYIMVDEAQDCNTDDWDLVQRLSARHGNLFVVGDPDQAIYQWRGARPDLFLDFPAEKTIILDENYRSTPKILDVANCVIANNRNRIPKDLFTRKAEGRAVIHYHGKSEREEMAWIADQIRLLRAAGHAENEFAVLYRSGYQSRAIEQALLAQDIPYRIWGGTRFFERREIKDAISYLRLIHDPGDDLAFLRIINVPSRKLGRSWIDQLSALAGAENRSLYGTLRSHLEDPRIGKAAARSFVALIDEAQEYARDHRISDLLNRVLDLSGLKRMIREDQDEARLENLDELLNSIRIYETSRSEDEVLLADYLQDIALYTNDDHRKDSPTVKLMTIHQAKGLEFPYVFILGLSEGIFPNMRTIREYKKRGEEEERRLMYVAITRAETALFLSESEGYNLSTKTNKYPSRFLTEIRREMLVSEGVVPAELWLGTQRFRHVLDEEVDFSEEQALYKSPFRIGDPVTHAVFGPGKILSINQEYTRFEVLFADGSSRFLRAQFLQASDLPES